MCEVAQWGICELELEAECEHEAPLWDVEALVEFRGPDSEARTVEAFWDGGRTWRARFSPSQRGEWSWRSRCEVDAGLDGRQGALRCVRYSGDEDIYLRGPVRLAADRRRYAFQDGTPFFWLADTAWNGAIRSRPEDWDLYLRKRSEQGFTVIQFVTTQWRGCPQDQYGQTAYRADGRLSVNPVWFQRIDAKIDAVNAHGLIAAPVVLWACVQGDPGYSLPLEDAGRLARYVVARYAAHRVIWLLGGDGNYGGERAERWRRIVKDALRYEPGNPVTLHMCGQNWAVDDLRDADWLDFIGYQSGHGSNEQHLRWLVQGPPSEEWRKEPPRPVINLEPNYEGHPSYHEDLIFSDRHVRRACYWSLMLAHTAGVTYGHNYVWPWAARPEVPQGHEGLGQVGPWRDGLEPPGVKSIVVMERFFDRLPWWELRPAQELLNVQPGHDDPKRYVTACMTEEGSLALAYMPKGGELMLDTGRLRKPARATWFNPRNGRRTDAGQVTGEVHTFATPDQHDWVLQIGDGR